MHLSTHTGGIDMTQNFVRYSPEVERADPTFDDALRTVIESTTHYITGSVEAEGVERAVRDAHAKGYGLARGEVEILDGVSPAYAQGIYATPGRHEAMVRFSNGSAHTGADVLLGNVVGMGLKILGVDGPTLLEDEPDSGTFDYALINHPVFFANTVEHYVYIQELFVHRGEVPPPNESPESARARFHQFLYDFLTGMSKLRPEEWGWEELGAFLSFRQIEPTNLLLPTYWTMGAVRHGDYIAKVRVTPVRAYAEQVVRRTLDPASASEIFRPALVAELQERPYEFTIQVQLCTDLVSMPVEDVTVVWPETLSPFVTVAKLHLPQQDIGGEDNLAQMDAISMTPWRCTEDHRPLGNIQRARKEVYRQSSLLRHQLNHQVRKEPKNLAEVFGV
jgi:catalase